MCEYLMPISAVVILSTSYCWVKYQQFITEWDMPLYAHHDVLSNITSYNTDDEHSYFLLWYCTLRRKQDGQIATASHKISACKFLLASLSSTVFSVAWLHIQQLSISIKLMFFFLIFVTLCSLLITFDWHWCYVATKFLIGSEHLYASRVCQNLVHNFFIHLFKKPLRAQHFECRALLQKLTVAQRVKKFLTFCETLKFRIIFVRGDY